MKPINTVTFSSNRLQWGDYKIDTGKDSDGYLDTRSTLYSNGSATRIKLSPQSPSARLTLKLGPKAGTITGHIKNSINGQAVNAGVRLWRIARPDYWLEKSLPSEYLLLVPPGVPLGMEVQAEGYAPWYYPGATKPGGILTQRTGQIAVIDIELTPLAKSPRRFRLKR